MYVTNSLYSVCLLHALRHFKREQFLFLRYEDMMEMDATSLLKLLGRFAGLYTGHDLLAAAVADGACIADQLNLCARLMTRWPAWMKPSCHAHIASACMLSHV